jgi:hypothetical protein
MLIFAQSSTHDRTWFAQHAYSHLQLSDGCRRHCGMRSNRRGIRLSAGLDMADALSQPLPDDLAEELADGWRFDEDGAFLLRSQTVGHPRPSDMDLTGWEAFQTHIHVPQDDLDPADENWARHLWWRAMAFACHGLRSAAKRLEGRECLAIVGLGSWQDGATVRFHLERGAPWVADNLEGYDSAIAVISSTDIADFLGAAP